MTPDPANAYLRTKVLTASPAELRLMLIDGAIRFARQGRAALAARDFEGAYNGLSQTKSILLELINCLRPQVDPDLCSKLSALYTFMYRRLLDATMEKDPAIVDEVLSLLDYERETWVMLMDTLAREGAAPHPAGAGPTPQRPATGGADARRTPLSVEG